MDPYYVEWHMRSKQQDRLREVDETRRIKLALAARRDEPHSASQALSRLGAWLVSWGCHLQKRHGAPAQSGAVPARHNAGAPCP
jgi:hypothetical protein